MKKILSIFFLLAAAVSYGQSVLPLTADSIKSKGELIIENQTRNIKGFLLNKGVGRTEFVKIQAINDSAFTAGEDTIVIRGTAGGSVETAMNVGSGVAVYKTKDGQQFKFKTLISDTSLVFDTSDPDVLKIVVDPGKFASVQRLRDSIAEVKKIVVTSIYRKPGIDSLYFWVGGSEYAVKDSTGGPGGAQFPGYTLDTDPLSNSPFQIPTSEATFNAIVAGGTTQIVQITQSGLDGSTGLVTNKIYYLTDAGKQGPFLYTGTAANQSGDNGGTVIVTADLKVYKRIYNGPIDVRWFGAVADVVVPGSGSTVTGTDNKPMFQAAINAAADGETVDVPFGNWGVFSPLDTIKGPKRVHLRVRGNTYHNGADFIILANASGPTEQHTIEHLGWAIGRVNIPSFSPSTYAAGTGPKWDTFTGTPFKIYNCNQQYIKFNRVEGFLNGAEVIGYDYDGATRGCEENIIEGRIIQNCANGTVLTSINGRSFVDKTYFQGWGGGKMTIRCGLAIKIDGYAGVAYNGEIYNGAFRSNEYHLLIERCDSVAICNGDITEPWFDVTIEGSGVHSGIGWQMRDVSPNFVRNPRWTGGGVYGFGWFNEGHMGRNAQGIVPMWDSPNGRYYSNLWCTDAAGTFFVVGSTLTDFQRKNSPSWIHYAPGPVYETDTTITSTAYTAKAGDHILGNNTSLTVTMPSATSNLQQWVYIKNISSATLTIVNAEISSLAPGAIALLRSDGVWRNWANTVSTSVSGGGDVSSNTSTSVAGEFALFSDNFGKTLKRMTGTGFVKATSGVASVQSGINISDINATGGTTTSFLRKDGTWATPSGTGGSSQWDDLTGGIGYNGSIGIGTLPSSFFALAHIGASTTSKANFEFASGAYPTSMRNGQWAYNGTFWKVQSQNIPQFLTTDVNEQVLYNKGWGGPNKISMLYWDPSGAPAGSMYRVDANGTGMEAVRQPYQVIHSTTTPFLIAGIAPASLTGGSQSLGSALAVGDIIEASGFGTTNGGNSVQLIITIGGKTVNLSFEDDGSTNEGFEFFIRFVPTTLGTSGTGSIIAWAQVNGQTKAMYINANQTPINTVSPTINVQWDFIGGTSMAATLIHAKVTRQNL